jgi:putative transposase
MSIKTYKYRAYPTKTQEKDLIESLDVCRAIYNTCLRQRIDLYEKEHKSITGYGQIKLLPTLNIPNLDKVYSQVRQQVILRLDNAFKGFFRRLKAGEKPGFPRFKGIGRFDSLYYPQLGFSLTDSYVSVSKIGKLRLVIDRPIVGKIKTFTIKRNCLNQWYVYFVVEQPTCISKVSIQTSTGIDLGCKHFATLSNGTQIEHPHYYKQSEDKLSKIQSKYAKLKTKPRDNKQKLKAKKQLAKTHIKITNQRTDFLHKLTTTLIKQYDLICIEDLNIKGMTENNYRNLNKSIMDSGWEQFSRYLFYKAENAGKEVVKVNPAYTSQICSNCGTLVKKDLAERIHKCPTCTLQLDRDLNAAINILSFGTKLFNSL